jgi:SNF2 family DNA or RNA helicase
MKTFIPRDYQYSIINRIVENDRCAIYAGMGMGKTSSTLCAIEFLKLTEGLGPVLVLAPLRVAASTWPQEAEKWGFDLRVVPVVGSAREREKALETDADVYTMNYENIPWLIDYYEPRWPFNMIVADEATRLKGFRFRGKAVRSKALARVAFRSYRFVELTGTPAPNGLLDLWGQLWFIDRGARLGRSYHVYASTYFRPKRVGRSPFAIQYVPFEWTQEAIQEKIADVSMSLNAADYFPIDTPINVTISVSLPREARVVYDKLQNDFFAKIENAEIEVANAAAMTTKCLQVASGFVYHDDGDATLLHDAKIEALKSIIEEANGAPVLVAYQWQEDARRIKDAIPGARLLDKDPSTIAAWNAGDIPVLLAHPASAGHGLNLQDGGNILVFYSLWWNLEHYQQIIERIGPTRQLQAGHPRPVFIYHIITTNTLDETVLKCMATKGRVQDLLLEALADGKRQKTDNSD